MTLEAAIWLTKFVHLAGISIWVCGLLAMPFLMIQRSGLEGAPLYRLQRMVRFLFVALISPVAFVAIGTGTALIFLRWTLVEWFTLKLAFVGVLAGLHVLTGLLVLEVFKAEGRMGAFAATALMAGELLASIAILALVLGKPALDAEALAGGLLSPGGLGRALGPVVEPILEPLISLMTP